MKNDNLGNRMKEYEAVTKVKMARRIPVMARVDGKAFHTFCKRFERPYDEFFNNCMNEVMKFICENVQGAKFAERHSDEISILITDYEKLTTDSYFDYNVQKIVSVIASMATAELCRQLILGNFLEGAATGSMGKVLALHESWPMFDCRCFNIPEHEIANYFWWRMLDAKRNSINMLAQSKFSHKELQGVTCNEMQEMLFSKEGINWNDVDQGQKAGFMCSKQMFEREVLDGFAAGTVFNRREWTVEPSPVNKNNLNKNNLDEKLWGVFHEDLDKNCVMNCTNNK